MYWELWLSQVTASAALVPCMLVQNKGGQALCVDVETVERLDNLKPNCLAKEKDIKEVYLNISLIKSLCSHLHAMGNALII